MLRWAAYLGLAAGAVAIAMFLFPRLRTGGLAVLLCAVLVGAMVAAVPLGLQKRARSVPVINEVTTDPVKASPLQQKAYPDIHPLIVDAPPGGAFVTAKAVAQEMGWEIVREDPQAGTIAAVATTFWFGFKDDVEIRVSPQGNASRIDLRSRSRVGKATRANRSHPRLSFAVQRQEVARFRPRRSNRRPNGNSGSSTRAGLVDELQDHSALAHFLALVDAAERVHHVGAAGERDGEQELPVLELQRGQLRGARRGVPLDDENQLARRNQVASAPPRSEAMPPQSAPTSVTEAR